jgi:L-lactate dehydrogenase complex protein LldG
MSMSSAPLLAPPKRGVDLAQRARSAVNALAYLAQHLIALLDPGAIVGNLHHAYRDLRFKTAHYAVLVTGPSATADIEGVLIHGASLGPTATRPPADSARTWRG